MAVTQLRQLCEENGAEGLVRLSSRTPHGAASPAERSDSGADADLVEELARELCKALEELTKTKADLKRARDERQTSTAELMSASEELQRSKDELDAAKLKLHSTKAELRSEKCAVESAQDDTRNLLSSSDVGTLILDARLRVKLFTTATRKLINLGDRDVGRPLSELSRIVEDARLPDDCRALLAGSVPVELEIPGPDHTRYLRRLQPYRTAEGGVEGVVITYVDITTRATGERRLRQSERDCRMMFDISPVRLLEQDRSALQPPTASTSYDWILERMHPEDRATDCMRIRAAISDKRGPWQVEHRFLRAGGVFADAHAPEHVAVTRNDQGGVAPLPHDTLAVADLKPAQKELHTVLDAATDAIITINGKARILSFNPAAESIFRRLAKDVMGQGIVGLFGAVSGRLLTQYLTHGKCSEPLAEQRIRKREGQPMDGLRGDGEVFPVEVSVWPVGGCDRFVIMARDLSERRRLEREIVETRTSQQLEIGREIHDGLGQELTALLMMVSRVERALSRFDDPLCAADFGKMSQCLRRAFDTARGLSKGLTAADIAPDGLPVALQVLSDRMGSASGIECSFSCAGNVDVHDQSRIAHLYRIAQEALSNAVRHAEACSIEMRLEGTSQGLVLSVRDDGRGIHPTPQSGDGLGLRLMRYRAGILGGVCNVESQPGVGTLVRCEVPLRAADSER